MEEWKIGRVGGWKAVRCLTWRAVFPRSGEWETDSGRLVSSSEAAIQESLGRQAKIGRMEDWKGGGMESGQMLTWRTAVPRSREWETDSGRRLFLAARLRFKKA